MIWMVLLGGALGAWARYSVATWMLERISPSFPWGTLTVNAVGSFVIGVIGVMADEHGSVGPHARTFLIVGVLGGFTTFSSFSIETMRLWEHGEFTRFGVNVVGNITLSLLAVILGTVVARTFLPLTFAWPLSLLAMAPQPVTEHEADHDEGEE